MKDSYTSKDFFALVNGDIEDAKLDLALEKLKLVCMGKSPSLVKKCSLLKSRLKAIKDEQALGTISYSDYSIERNRLTEAIFNLLEEVCISEFTLLLGSNKSTLSNSLVINAKQYFEKSESHLLLGNIDCYVGHLRKCQAFFIDEYKQIQLLHAPGGYGKSHFLKQIGEEGEKHFDEVLIFTSAKTDTHEILRDLQQRFERSENKTLLMLDDAERKLDVLPAVFKFISQNKNVKLLITSRSAGVESVENMIKSIKHLPLKYQEPINFSQWKDIDLIRILRLAATQKAVKHEEHIVKHINNPYLLVELGKHIAGLSEYDMKAIRENITAGIIADCQITLKSLLLKTDIPFFLAHLSLLSPVDRQEQDKVIEFLASKFSLTIEKTTTIYQKLLKVGILKEISYSIRFNPDTKGDFFLANFLKGKTDIEILSFLEPHFTFNESKTISNLEASLNYLPEGKSLLDVLIIVINQWKEVTKETEGLKRRQRIKAISNLVIYDKVGSAAIDLVNEYLRYDSDKSVDPNDYYARLNANPDLNEYAPFLIQLIKRIDKRAECLDIIEKLHIKKEESYASNYQTVSLVAEACKFFNNNIESYQVCLDFIEKWIDSKDKHLLDLAKHAIKPIITATNEHYSSEYNTMTFGERLIPDDKKYFSIRDKAVGLLLKMLERQNAMIIAINLIGNIGTGGRLKSEDFEKLPMSVQFRKERSMVIPALSKLLFETKLFKVKKAIENLFFRWWLLNISNEVVPYLQQMKRNPEYLVLKYAFNAQFIIKDFQKILQEAPVTHKWEWYWSNKKESRRWDEGWEYYEELTEKLSSKYITLEGKVNYLVSLHKTVNEEKLAGQHIDRHLFQIITAWVHGDVEQFELIKRNSNYWNKISEDFQTVITQVLMQQGKLTLEDVGEEIMQALPDPAHLKLNSFLMLLRKESAATKEKWFYKFIKKGNQNVSSYIAADLNWQFPNQKDAEKMVDILTTILEKEDPAESFFSNRFIGAGFTYEAILKNKEFIPTHQYEKLRTLTFDWIKKVSQLNYDVEHCVQFSISSVDDLQDFLAYRIQNWSLGIGHRNTTPFQVSDPFFEHGISLSWIEKLFILPEQYRKFLDVFIQWREESPIGIQNSFKDFLRLLKNLINPKNKQKFINEYVEECLGKSAVEKALILTEYIPQNEEDYLLVIKVWDRALETHQPEAVEKAIHRWNREGGFSTSWNGSREYADIAMFEKLLSLLKGTQVSLKKILQEEYHRAKEALTRYEKRSEGEWLR